MPPGSHARADPLARPWTLPFLLSIAFRERDPPLRPRRVCVKMTRPESNRSAIGYRDQIDHANRLGPDDTDGAGASERRPGELRPAAPHFPASVSAIHPFARSVCGHKPAAAHANPHRDDLV